MKIGPITINEEERLAAIQKYGILDTEFEIEYDDIVKLASQVCDTPIALITFVDRDRQWFKAKVGLELRETSRDLSFCAHTISEDDFLIVPDALLDERFSDNPLVLEEPKIRFYAGLPLVSRSGFKLGTLVVIDRKPRTLSKQQFDNLRILGRQVTTLLELRANVAMLRKENSQTASVANKEIEEIFARVSDAFVALDSNWMFTYLSPKAGKIFNKPEAYLLGKNIWQEFPELADQPLGRVYMEAMASQNARSLEAYESVHDQWFESHIYPSVTGLSVYFHDITEKKKAQLASQRSEEQIIKERDLSNALINSAPGIFYMYDAGGKFIRWNRNFETISGYSKAEISSMHPLDFFANDEKDLVSKRINDVFEFGHAEVEADLCTRDKRRIPYYFTGYVVEFNDVKCLAGMGVDISALKIATKSHRQAEERYRDIFENAIEGIYQTTIEGRFITVNPALATMLGYASPAEMINSITDLRTQVYSNPDDRVRLQKMLEKDGYALNVELKLKKKSGEAIWVVANDRAIKDEFGKIKYLEGTLQDVTARKEAQEKLRLQQKLNEIIIRAQALFISSENPRHAFDTLLHDLLSITQSEYGFIGEVLLDMNGNPYLKTHTITNISWNEETRKFYDDNIEEGIVFSNLKTLFGKVLTTGKPVISNNPAIDPRRGGLPEGHPPLLAFLGLPFGSGDKMEGMLGLSNRAGGYDQELLEFLQPLISTLTHLIKASKNEKLRKQIQSELHHQFESLQKTNHELDHFVYSVSHDLRAPLASILGLVNVAEMEEPGASQKKYLHLIRSSVNRLDGFIKDILDYSKNSRTELRSKRIDFRKIIAEAKTRLSALTGSDRVTFQVDIEERMPFYSDESRIDIILNNLMNNAIKYQDYHKASAFGRIEISVSSERAVIRFSDNGIGIEPEHLDKIFNMFYRGTDKATGSGIGLYIVKEAVLKLNGNITVQSDFGKSTTFEIAIPQATSQTE